MLILGLEGSANKLGVGVVREDGAVLSNLRRTFNAPPGAGFRPTEVVAHHKAHILDLIAEALAQAGVAAGGVTHIAYTRGPGLGGPLAAVALVARTLCLLWGVPLIPVNHCVAHIEMGRLLTRLENPVILYASGGNTQILAFSHGRYRVFGETLDVAVGNCLDKFARDCGISNDPAPGYNIEQLALEWQRRHAGLEPGAKAPADRVTDNDADRHISCRYGVPIIHSLPVVIKGMDISCSGLSTHCAAYYKAFPDTDLRLFCYSLQETLFAALTEITERAAAHVGARDILTVGGVGCNERLQEMLRIMACERGGNVGAMDERYCVDNGAMIAWTGVLMVQAASPDIIPPDHAERGTVSQRYRTDAVRITWREGE